MAILFASHQIVCETAATYPQVIDARISATLKEKPSTQCAVG
jgi:hypothetical protein